MLREREDGSAVSVDKGHGRLEIRRLVCTTRLSAYLDGWAGVRQVGLIERTRRVGDKTTTETVAFVTSLPPERASPERLPRIARSHWSIENALHLVRDAALGEDACRTRAGAQVPAAVRNAVLAALRAAGIDAVAPALRRFAAQALAALDLLRRPLAF